MRVIRQHFIFFILLILIICIKVLRDDFQPSVLLLMVCSLPKAASSLLLRRSTEAASQSILDFGFWILDFGLTPTTRVWGKPNNKTENFGFVPPTKALRDVPLRGSKLRVSVSKSCPGRGMNRKIFYLKFAVKRHQEIDNQPER